MKSTILLHGVVLMISERGNLEIGFATQVTVQSGY